MIRTAVIFGSLEGRWAFNRVIRGHGIVNGIATFIKKSPQSKTLRYREDGLFTQEDGKAFNVFREYSYRLKEDKISVYFAEKPKRLFHTLDFSSLEEETASATAKASHQCDCDTYDAVYEFTGPDEFTLAYRVSGPKKNYTMKTVFKRCVN